MIPVRDPKSHPSQIRASATYPRQSLIFEFASTLAVARPIAAMELSRLNHRSRFDPYDPLPPPPHFSSNYNPHHLPPPPALPPPPPIHRRHDRGPAENHPYFSYPASPDPSPFERHPHRAPDFPPDLPPYDCLPPPPPRAPHRRILHDEFPLHGRGRDQFPMDDHFPYRIGSQWDHEVRSPAHPYLDDPPGAYMGRKRPRWESWDRDRDSGGRGRDIQRRMEPRDDEHPRHHHQEYHRREQARLEASFGMSSISPPVVSRSDYISNRGGEAPPLFEPFNRGRGGGVGDFPHFESFNRGRGRGSGSGVGDLPEFEPFNGGRGGGVGDLPEFEPFNRGRGRGSGSGVSDLPEFEPFNRGRGGGVGDLPEFEPFNRGRGGEDTLQFEQFMPNRGRGGEDHLGVEQRLTPPPSFYTADYSRSTMEVNEETRDNRGYAENNLLGSRGKRVPSGTPKKEKPNVASRIQSGKSVWERIEERPAFLPYTGNHQLESDALDLSFNSDAFMAKVVESSVPVGPSSEVKVIPALNPTGIKKKIKKKDVMKRTRVVIPIVTTSKSPTSAKGAQGAALVGKSSEIIALSGKTVSNGSPQSCLKTPLKTASGLVGKKAAKKSAKTVVMKEDGVTVDASEEDAKVKEESRKYADALLSEISTQLFQHGSLLVATPKEKIAGEQSEEPGSSARTGDVKDISEERFVTPDGKPGSNCVDPVCSVTGVVDNDTSKISDQTGDVAVTSNEASTAGGSCKTIDLVDNEVAVEYVERSPQTREITVCTELSLTPAYEAQVEMPFGSVTFPGSCSTPKGKRGKRKREVEEKHQQFATGKVSVLSDSSFDLNVNGTATVLTAEMMDVVLDQRQHDGPKNVDGPKDDEDNGIDLQVSNEPKSGYARLGPDYLGVSMIDSVVKQKVDSLTAVFKVREHSFDTQNNLPFNSSFVSEENKEVRSNKFMPPQLPPKVQSLLPCQPKKQMLVDKKIVGQEPVRKTNAASGVTRAVPIRVTSAGPTKVPTRSSHSVRNKTWHRNETPSSESVSHGNLEGPGEQSQKKFGRPPNSYIRKGNSLIRKPAPDVHPPKQAYDLDISSKTNRDAMKRSICDEIEVKKTDTTIISNLPFERPKTPPLPPSTKLTNCTMNLPSEYPYPISEEPNPEIDAQTCLVQAENQAIDLLSGTPENQNITSGRKSEPSNLKKMVYVKPKSNQLVAAPRPEACTQILASFPSSDHYYRRKKNQLVRNASKTDIRQKQDAVSSFGNSISDNQRISTVSNMKRSTATKFMKRLDKVLQKTYKHPKCSRVWTLSGEMPNAKGVSSSNRWKVLPHLLPWKRTIYSRKFNRNNMTVPRRSLSLFSKKLQHTRLRNTIYKVSTDGFSLRKAGVVSIGGSSLKWSKSIEKHSKKASKEATLAVAEAERKKRETHVTTSVGAKGKSGRALPRERIFRIGSARYKMEASRRSLVRIPDERSSSAVDLKSGNNSQTPFVPRRLLIGNDEYIHVGNGNKLVRDPKKLVRILATEKVRWSLHTARLRLAKKQQYCQFFTRFGKCNKNGGKCPYIHDPAKIAICTKFVRGLCSNTNCKLTHKVLPERMPDCSYYLQALCTNINCPYRHVHVNPKASVCEDFLKGYCADGDECLKKHSYVCPPFEATGKCLEGSKCKLHHPKPKSKPKKKKVPIVQSSSHRRYFGSSVLEAGPLIAASDQHVMENVGDFFYSDGQCTDYIPLDIGSEGDVEVDDLMDFEQIPCGSEFSEMQENDLDALIKPVLIMKANLTNPCSGS